MKNEDTIQDKYGHVVHPDAPLVKACLKGDGKSQRLLYEHYKKPVFRMCLRYACCREEAEDYLQDGFVKVFKDLAQYRMEGPLGAWIRKVVLNTILQQLRKKRLLLTEKEPADLDNPPVTNEDLPGNLDVEILTNYIQSLPDGYRTVFNMFAIEGFTHQEIAEALNITVGTSKSQLSKARALLKARLSMIHTTEHI